MTDNSSDEAFPPEGLGSQEIDDLGGQDNEDSNQFQELIKEIKKRCQAAGIAFEEKEDSEFDPEFIVQMPNGREKRPFHFFILDRAKAFLELPFERLTLLGNYVAYLDREDGTIEAALTPLSPFGRDIKEGIFGIRRHRDKEAYTEAHVELISQNGSQKINIGTSSNIII